MTRRKRAEGVDLSGNDTTAPALTEAARVDSKGRRWTRVKCKTCERFYEAAYKVSEGPPTARCCGGLYCYAVQHWTNEEWELRAESVRHRPPLKPWAVLRHAPNSQCLSCGRSLGIYVLPAETTVPVDGWQSQHDRVVACVGCQQVVRTFQHAPSASDLIDVEALRRYPSSVDAAA